ncbi:MAG: uracil phosphoribosyltransferase [Planctomycetota bacterium]|nr:uracil phosphoribosyltransferase [Planctomycetota bacterium]
MGQLIQIDHPLVQSYLTVLRDDRTPSPVFRTALRHLTALLLYEATADLEVSDVEVRTPLAETHGAVLDSRVALVPILRAGLGMVDPALELLPEAEVWHLGYYRDESTLEPVEYYSKLPQGDPVDVALVLDPMLATGGSALCALRAVARWGVERIKLLAVIAAPEGVRHVQGEFARVPIYVAALDSHLDENGFIVPGLGDAGDRFFRAHAR